MLGVAKGIFRRLQKKLTVTQSEIRFVGGYRKVDGCPVRTKVIIFIDYIVSFCSPLKRRSLVGYRKS